MGLYDKEILALKKSNRFRSRVNYNEDVYDFASNDYLGLSQNKSLFKQAYENVAKFKNHSSKSSLLVNGYHIIHQRFEQMLCDENDFENGIVVGNGFMANLAIIEALTRRFDVLFIDEEYHASGIMASKLIHNVVVFKHNDMNDLNDKLNQYKYNRAIIAVEGIYSMSGDLVDKRIFDISNKDNALLVLDEAHSVGVIGDNLLGVLDFYNITNRDNIIKMGTLGKAISSYGAYILASNHIISYLENRAKSIIYTTAPSLFDIELARVNFMYIKDNISMFKSRIKYNQDLVYKYLNIKKEGLIFNIQIGDNKKVLEIQKKILKQGFLVGSIREPTVKSAIIRLIGRVFDDKLEILLCEMNKYLDT